MTPGLKACLLCILGDIIQYKKIIIYQLSYEILDIIMKIWPIITPIISIQYKNNNYLSIVL